MQHIPQELKDRVEAVIDDCLERIRAHYGKTIRRPHVNYELTGTTAGTASYGLIRLHGGLLVEHGEDFIMSTVPHEFAHLATDHIYPETKQTFRDDKRVKAQPHGAKWKEVMGVLGQPPDRTHCYDMSKHAKPKSKYHYECPNCKNIIVLGPSDHEEQQNPRSEYKTFCGNCVNPNKPNGKYRLVFVRDLGKLLFGQAVAAALGRGEVGPKAKFVLKMKAPTGNSKMARCWEFYKENWCFCTRQTLIDIFVEQFDCTRAGAATYYANCKKLYENGVR